MAENKESFILYRDIIHTVKKLPREKQGDLFMTILMYVNDDNPTVTDPLVDLAWTPIMHNLKRTLKKWESVKQTKIDNGRKGGLAKASESKRKLANLPVSVNVSVPVNVNDNVISKKKPLKIEEVQNYFFSKTKNKMYSGMQGEKFWNHYESNGWKVGKNPMKDFKACVRNWILKEPPTTSPIAQFKKIRSPEEQKQHDEEIAAIKRGYKRQAKENKGNKPKGLGSIIKDRIYGKAKND